MSTYFHGGLAGKSGRGLICQGLMCGRRFWYRCPRVDLPLQTSLPRFSNREPGEGGPSTGNFGNWLKEGSSYGASLSMGALLGELGGGLLCWGPCSYERKVLEMGNSLHGGSDGQPGVGLSTGDSERWLKGALLMEHLSLWELCEGNLEGQLPCWGP